MDNDKIIEGLKREFTEYRIVFWQDIDAEFQETLPELDLGDVTVIRLNEEAALKVKVDVELEYPHTKFLLYATGRKPEPKDDWLRDMRHYGGSFSADRSSMILSELGLVQAHMRDHISARAKFFASKDRTNRLARIIEPNDNEASLDLKIMAVILRLDQWDYFTILAALLDGAPDYADLTASPAAWDDFIKYDLIDRFWELANQYFAYADDEPNLRDLMLRMLVTDYGAALKCPLPNQLEHLQLPAAGTSNTVVCFSQWRDNAVRHNSFDAISNAVADDLQITQLLTGVDVSKLRDVKTFQSVDKFIASSLRDQIIQTWSNVDVSGISELCVWRKDGYWANVKRTTTHYAPRDTLSTVYDALIHAARMFELRNAFDGGFSYATPKAFWKAYTTELYQFDQLYRYFCECADTVELEGWDILKGLRQQIEDCYCNWYLMNLANKWGDTVETQLLNNWNIDLIDRQSRFFNAHVQPILNKGDDRRIFVIISDAFRYEAAQELADKLNGQYRFSADLSSMLGVVPSYTALGMASLLPHKELTYVDKDVRADGMSTSGIENRKKILSNVNGTAIKAEDLIAMNKTDSREFIKDYQVIYVYHNQIDQTADTGNEDKTFQSVRTTIDELSALVGRIVNNMGGNNIVITADHGFLFNETAPTSTDRNALGDKPAGTIVSKKRYLIGNDLGSNDKAYSGKISATSAVKDETEFWVPKGANRFHFVGGARFVHGGAMLQEICIPLIKVQQVRGPQAERTRTKSVGISVLGNNAKITVSRIRFQFIQNEPVSDRIKPLTATIAIYEDGNPVSDVRTVTFDSREKNLCAEWQKEVWLTLSSQQYDRQKPYQLILRDAEDKTEITRMDVTIDLAFSNDFDF